MKEGLPRGCYWVGTVIYARARVKGRLVRWSLHTSNPRTAKRRREALLGPMARKEGPKLGGSPRLRLELPPPWRGPPRPSRRRL
jgi:hypothetical protein